MKCSLTDTYCDEILRYYIWCKFLAFYFIIWIWYGDYFKTLILAKRFIQPCYFICKCYFYSLLYNAVYKMHNIHYIHYILYTAVYNLIMRQWKIVNCVDNVPAAISTWHCGRDWAFFMGWKQTCWPLRTHFICRDKLS